MRVKGAPRREGVDSRPYFLIHTPFIPIVPLGILPGGFFFYCQPEGLSRCSGSLDLDKGSRRIHLPFSSTA